MMLELFLLVIMLSFIVYRVGRFIVLDTMFEGTREKVYAWLYQRDRFIWHKIAELIGCPYCITVWVSAAVCFIWRWTVDDFAAPIGVWLAVAAGSLVLWRIIDWKPDEDD